MASKPIAFEGECGSEEKTICEGCEGHETEKDVITVLCCINDSTGSILPYLSNYVGGINEFLGEQAIKDTTSSSVFYNTMVFGGERRMWKHSTFVSISEFVPYTEETYRVDGMTALYDAIGEGISKVDAFVEPLQTTGQRLNIVFFIQTDGHENSSLKYTQETIRALISERQNKREWKFIFIGANQDAILTGTNLGVARGTTATYGQTQDSIRGVYRAVSENVSAYRDGGVLPSFSVAQRMAASVPEPKHEV